MLLASPKWGAGTVYFRGFGSPRLVHVENVMPFLGATPLGASVAVALEIGAAIFADCSFC
ncbi:hypothetical protein ABIF34_006733 [Bradyrhizobium japonicum]